MKNARSGLPQGGPTRRDRLIQEANHDPYRTDSKMSSPAVCPDCGAVFLRGRWTWETAAPESASHVCPACQRIREQVPAAFLTLEGSFLVKHRDEIMGLIANLQREQEKEHPLKRIMSVKEQDSATTLELTDPHLARGIGEALHRAFGGELEYNYNKGETLLRVAWRRDAG